MVWEGGGGGGRERDWRRDELKAKQRQLYWIDADAETTSEHTQPTLPDSWKRQNDHLAISI